MHFVAKSYETGEAAKIKWSSNEFYTVYLKFFVLLTRMLRDPFHGPRLRERLASRFSSAR